jgi:hypothetical protein
MDTEYFLKPRLTGARFEGHAIPLELLKDLSVLQEMVVEVAKWKFLQEHGSRQRVPRGFTEGIELKLTGLEEGSTIPVISLFVATKSLFPPVNQDYFVKARDAIVYAIEAAEQNKPITEYLPEKTLGYFDRIGRSLRDGEAMEFITPVQGRPARLTKETRRKLVFASAAQEYTEEKSIRGLIPEIDQDDMTFEIQLPGGSKIKAPLSEQHQETILLGVTGYKTGIPMLVQGIGKFSRQGRLQGFESIEHVSILDILDVPTRLDELQSMKDGWLEGKGIAPKKEGLDWLKQIFELSFPDDLPLPYVYPTAEGGIQAEWSIGSKEISLAIDFESKHGEWHNLNLETMAEETEDLYLDDPLKWQWLIGQIRQINGVIA